MLHLVNQRYDIVTTTPERSAPSSPSLSPAVVTHTVATSSKPQRRSWNPSAVDLTELSKLLVNSTSNTSPSNNPPASPRPKNNARPRSQLFQSSKPPSPTLSTSSAEPTFCTNSNAAAPILITTSQQQPRPILSHRPASTCSTPSQFVFKKPEYDERYHKTHFHRQSSSQSLQHNNERKDLFLAWSDLRRFFVNTQQQQQQQQQCLVSPTSPTGSTHSQEEPPTPTTPKSETFANQFRQDIGGRYGTWGKLLKNKVRPLFVY